MTELNFQERLSRIQEKHAAALASVALPKNAPQKQSSNGSSPSVADMVLLPQVFLIGFSSVILGRIISFHFGTEHGTIDLGAGVAAIADLKLDLLFVAMGLFGLYMKESWVQLGALAVGAYFAYMHEHVLMGLMPDFWSELYARYYVTDTLYDLGYFKR